MNSPCRCSSFRSYSYGLLINLESCALEWFAAKRILASAEQDKCSCHHCRSYRLEVQRRYRKAACALEDVCEKINDSK